MNPNQQIPRRPVAPGRLARAPNRKRFAVFDIGRHFKPHAAFVFHAALAVTFTADLLGLLAPALASGAGSLNANGAQNGEIDFLSPPRAATGVAFNQARA